jgi:hypothetical protein
MSQLATSPNSVIAQLRRSARTAQAWVYLALSTAFVVLLAFAGGNGMNAVGGAATLGAAHMVALFGARVSPKTLHGELAQTRGRLRNVAGCLVVGAVWAVTFVVVAIAAVNLGSLALGGLPGGAAPAGLVSRGAWAVLGAVTCGAVGMAASSALGSTELGMVAVLLCMGFVNPGQEPPVSAGAWLAAVAVAAAAVVVTLLALRRQSSQVRNPAEIKA